MPMDTEDMLLLILLGALIGGYLAWGLTTLYFARKMGNGGHGGWRKPKLDVPDDLSGEEWPKMDKERP